MQSKPDAKKKPQASVDVLRSRGHARTRITGVVNLPAGSCPFQTTSANFCFPDSMLLTGEAAGRSEYGFPAFKNHAVRLRYSAVPEDSGLARPRKVATENETSCLANACSIKKDEGE